MYPISQGYSEVTKRLDALVSNDHHAEALLASVFALEKTMKRSLRFCALNRGFSSKQCDKILTNKGFNDIVNIWPVFERKHRSLPEFIGQSDWQHVPEAVTMRNKMVHGARVYSLADCSDATANVRTAMENLRIKSISELGCDPWMTLPGRIKSSLDWLGTGQPASKSQ